MNVSVVVPSKDCKYINFLIGGLRKQSFFPNELIIVIKDCDRLVKLERLCNLLSFECLIIKQRYGYVTSAMNIGKKEANGDIIIFTDDDAIPPRNWIKKYVFYYKKYPSIAGISSRDIYVEIKKPVIKIRKTPDDLIRVKLFRRFIRPIIEPPHVLFKKYRKGVYINNRYAVSHGDCIPDSICYSLPFRGVNMSFKADFIHDIDFIEHPLIKRGFEFEQHFGVQLIMKGYDTIYVPNNYVYHIVHESLSRLPKNKKYELLAEKKIIEEQIKELLIRNNMNEY